MRNNKDFEDFQNDKTIQGDDFDLGNTASYGELVNDKTVSFEKEMDNYFDSSNQDKTILLNKKKDAFAWIIKISKNKILKKYRLIDGTTTIGRSSRSDVVIDNEEVSEIHAKIIKEGNIFKIIDIGSLNGTYLNSKKINSPKILKDNDELKFGNIKFIFKKI
ncbi:MAG: FHA domain-containing protein [Deltaproteobacteria bacterium]|nr:FHA domain-containing protein [Deltaproteobacteria bacterium]